ncbi:MULTISPECIES: hypothetical protein [Halomonadaceae]|uniref:hypothetical protein n=1 Tax=Halomonadaceae TaxID=28256 RepID=UPI00159889EE|nr:MULTISPECIES: hypothetical protein [Halomonas]QJQ95496.1 hypothetical protein HIO72_09540 [Halomonas sp. PA5]
MRTLLLLQRPLSRRSVVFVHVAAQLSWLLCGGVWLAFHSPWLSTVAWSEAWPAMLLGVGVMLLVMLGTRLLAELVMLPHYMSAMRQGFAPSAVVTRSYERRPAVHDTNESWTSAARYQEGDDAVLGEARVTQPATVGRRRSQEEPKAKAIDKAPARKEPRL